MPFEYTAFYLNFERLDCLETLYGCIATNSYALNKWSDRNFSTWPAKYLYLVRRYQNIYIILTTCVDLSTLQKYLNKMKRITWVHKFVKYQKCEKWNDKFTENFFLIIYITWKMSKKYIQVIGNWYVMFALTTNENLSSGCSQLFYCLSPVSYSQKSVKINQKY